MKVYNQNYKNYSLPVSKPFTTIIDIQISYYSGVRSSLSYGKYHILLPLDILLIKFIRVDFLHTLKGRVPRILTIKVYIVVRTSLVVVARPCILGSPRICMVNLSSLKT